MLSKPNILVCTDFSSYSETALKIAEQIRLKTSGKVYVLHVSEHAVMWDWLSNEGLPGSTEDRLDFDISTNLKKNLIEQINKCNLKGEGHVLNGIPASVIMEDVADKKIDLIIMGHKGRTDTKFHIGSLAQKIVASSNVPVLITKKHSEINKVACLIDPSGPMKKIINWSEEFAFLFSTRLTIVSLFPDISSRFIGYGKIGFSTDLLRISPEQKEMLVEELSGKIKSISDEHAESKLRVEISTEKKIAYHLNAILEDEKVDLAILKRHQMGLLEKMIIGSETRRLMDIFEGNLLILPPMREES